VTTQAWLPRRRGVGGVVDAVDRVAPHLVLSRDEARGSGTLGGFGGLGRGGIHEYGARIDVPVAAVGADGSIRLESSGRDNGLTRSRLLFLADLPLRPIRGTFRRFDVRVQLDPDGGPGGTVEAVIEASSIQTGRAPRDLHLRSRGFLDAARSPRITFRSGSIARESDTISIEGELTIRGRSRPATLRGTVHELTGWTDGRRRVRVHAGTEVRWREWGMSGIPFVGDRLAIALDVVGVEVRPGSGRFNARSMADMPRPHATTRPAVVGEPA
jgi:polyisoprenoid-binding protein YceI